MSSRAQDSQDRLIHRLCQADLGLSLGPSPHALLETRITSPGEDVADFLRCEPLQRLIAPAMGMASLIGIIFEDDVYLIGGQWTGQVRCEGHLRDKLPVSALCHSGRTVIPQKDMQHHICVGCGGVRAVGCPPRGRAVFFYAPRGALTADKFNAGLMKIRTSLEVPTPR